MVPLAWLGPLGLPELLVILFIVVLLFGARKIPDLARSMGEGIRNFRAGLKEEPKERDDEKHGVSGGNEK